VAKLPSGKLWCGQQEKMVTLEYIACAIIRSTFSSQIYALFQLGDTVVQTLKEKIRMQTLVLLPVDHPLVRRRTARHSQRMKAILESVKIHARKSGQSPSSPLQQENRSLSRGHIPRRA